jgi:glutathione S-transferase
VGDSFTAADLTFAALTALLLLPEQFGSAGFSDTIRAAYPAELVAELRDSPAGRHALEMYRRHRSPGGPRRYDGSGIELSGEVHGVCVSG